MPKGSPELTRARREEIINACAKLYETLTFKDVTIKEIANFTSFTRPSIYNYFRTKEEIFLALLQREYEGWTTDLNSLCREHKTMSRDAFTDAFARSLAERPRLLKLLAMNHYDMEINSGPERLAEFKVVYGNTIRAVDACLKQFFPGMSAEVREGFVLAFFPFMFGIYPYTTMSVKQKEAMKRAKVSFRLMSAYEITYNAVIRLLGV